MKNQNNFSNTLVSSVLAELEGLETVYIVYTWDTKGGEIWS